jgi:hypothetical protein
MRISQDVSEKQIFFDFQVFNIHARRFSRAILNVVWSRKATQQFFLPSGEQKRKAFATMHE